MASDNEEATDDTPALSHKQLRKLKRKREHGEEIDPEEILATKAKKPRPDKEKAAAATAATKRENSVWVGNLSYKTTADDIRSFFDGTGEITRINMPKGPIKGSATRRENSGYAYVDFATEDAKTVAISLSEKNLHGRRLLIKDGNDFKGSKSATAALATDGKPVSLTKTSRKILAAQKEAPCPVLFMGNLGYEATKEQVRKHLIGHVQLKPTKGPDQWKVDQADPEQEKAEGENRQGGTTKKTTLLSFEPPVEAPTDCASPRKERDAKKAETMSPETALGLRKIRLFTFQDTGKCKGFCFLDFESTAHATAALIHPGNHYWNGRDLILQYASLDAVRRGGYPEADGKRVFVKGSQAARKASTDEQAPASTGDLGDSLPVPEEGRESSPPPRQLEGWKMKDDGGHVPVQTWQRRGATGGRVKQERPRPKPGAALAAAQRATSAIVPGQGKKTKF